MFSNFSDRVLKTFDGLLSRGVLTENDVNSAMREIRVALLEADVPLNIAKDFVEKVKKKAGAHTTGGAADIGVHGDAAYKIVKVAQEIGFTGVGIAQKGHVGTRFIHVDNLGGDDHFPRPWIWSY